MKVTSVSGVKVYDLSQGTNSIPEFLGNNSKLRRRISKDPEYARRVELLQDFNFPAYSRTVKVSRDGRYILASGGYKPHIKMFDVAEVSMKFERFVDADIIRADLLSDDFQKLYLMCEDRTLQFHSKFGMHHSVRMPFMGRDVSVDRETCDMYIATNRRSILRFNLMEGRFRQSWDTSQDADGAVEDQGNNAVVWNKSHRLVAAAGQDGCVRIWDPRQRTECGKLDGASPEGACTALQFDISSEASLSFVVGDSQGVCRVFDLRSSRAVLEKEHPYSTAIKSIQFKRGGGTTSGMMETGSSGGPVVITNDSKQVKGWNMLTGSTVFNIESKFPMDEITLAPLNKLEGDSSGLIFATGQAERVGTFFVPSLGPAPIWASFLESLTEELEEKDFSTYEDYRFVTKQELEDLNLSGLIGTTQLRPWMHGYFVEARTFEKLKAAMAKAMDKGELRKQKQVEQAKKKSQRIVLTEKIKVKVNPDLADRNENMVTDDRFSSLFQDPEFQIDPESQEYKQKYSSGMKRDKVTGRKLRTRDDDSDNDDVNDDDDDDDEKHAVAKSKILTSRTTTTTLSKKPVSTSKDSKATVATSKKRSSNVAASSKKSSFLDDGDDEDGQGNNASGKHQQPVSQEYILKAKTPLYKRLQSAREREDATVLAQTEDRAKGEMSITFVPKSDLRKQRKSNNRGADGDDDE